MASHRPRSQARLAVLASEPVTCPARLPALVTVAVTWQGSPILGSERQPARCARAATWSCSTARELIASWAPTTDGSAKSLVSTANPCLLNRLMIRRWRTLTSTVPGLIKHYDPGG